VAHLHHLGHDVVHLHAELEAQLIELLVRVGLADALEEVVADQVHGGHGARGWSDTGQQRIAVTARVSEWVSE
jgi:hypothetical protein